MNIFSKNCSTEKKNCSLCSIYIRIGLFCLGILWLWGNIEILLAWIQHVPLPSNAATQAAIVGDILIPIMIFIHIFKKKRKTS